jgi:hypothetical protein
MKNLLVQDNFLPNNVFKTIHDRLVWDTDTFNLMGPHWPWIWGPVGEEHAPGHFFLYHVFYNILNHVGYATSSEFQLIYPLIEKIKPVSIIRITANMNPASDSIVEYGYHIDFDFKYETTTSIYYVNTNNGYTKLEDGTVIESVANRFITFPTSTRHTNTGCTDKPQRIVINLNYFA